jgi:hypothetical protein
MDLAKVLPAKRIFPKILSAALPLFEHMAGSSMPRDPVMFYWAIEKNTSRCFEEEHSSLVTGLQPLVSMEPRGGASKVAIES